MILLSETEILLRHFVRQYAGKEQIARIPCIEPVLKVVGIKVWKAACSIPS